MLPSTFPGADEAELWRWLASQYPPFNRKVPGNDEAQEFLGKALAEHAKTELDGQAVVARMESDLTKHRVLLSFQLATLPHIGALNFTGEHELTAEALTAILTSSNDSLVEQRIDKVSVAMHGQLRHQSADRGAHQGGPQEDLESLQ